MAIVSIFLNDRQPKLDNFEDIFVDQLLAVNHIGNDFFESTRKNDLVFKQGFECTFCKFQKRSKMTISLYDSLLGIDEKVSPNLPLDVFGRL